MNKEQKRALTEEIDTLKKFKFKDGSYLEELLNDIEYLPQFYEDSADEDGSYELTITPYKPFVKRLKRVIEAEVIKFSGEYKEWLVKKLVKEI